MSTIYADCALANMRVRECFGKSPLPVRPDDRADLVDLSLQDVSVQKQ